MKTRDGDQTLVSALLPPVIVALCLHLLGVDVSRAQSLSSISIGSNALTLSALGSDPIATQEMGPHTAVKYELPDRNTLSATYRRNDGVIVYLETDWSGKIFGSYTDFRNFRFGQTTLAEVRSELGSNGIAYMEGPGPVNVGDDGSLAMFNSYDIKDTSLVVTFVSAIGKERQAQLRASHSDEELLQLLSGEAKLSAVILADATYLEGIWGNVRQKDAVYQPVRWND